MTRDHFGSRDYFVHVIKNPSEDMIHGEDHRIQRLSVIIIDLFSDFLKSYFRDTYLISAGKMRAQSVCRAFISNQHVIMFV